MIDMHSHILPGLDDGAADWDEALAMARVAVNDGIAEMVCTPHWVPGKYENDRETVLRRFAEFEQLLEEKQIPLKIHSGTELRIDTSIPDRLKDGRLLTLNNGSGYVLLELPDEIMPDNLDEFFWNLQLGGYQPILSHVEKEALWFFEDAEIFLGGGVGSFGGGAKGFELMMTVCSAENLDDKPGEVFDRHMRCKAMIIYPVLAVFGALSDLRII